MHRPYVLGIALALAGVVAAAALPHRPPEIPGVALLREAEELVYAQTGTTNQIESILRRARTRFAAERDPALRDYWTARTNLLLATHYNQTEETRRAVREIEAGFEAIDASLDRAGAYSDGLRVKSDLHSQMMFARGLFYMVRNGAEARDLAFEALDLDSNNIRAHVTVAGFYLNAPPMAGGDPEEGRRVLEAALALDPPIDTDRFIVLVLLTEAALDTEDRSTARRYYRLAAEVFPDSRWLEDTAPALQG